MDKCVRLYNTDSGVCERTLTGHAGEVYCVAFALNGTRLASACDKRQMRVWDVSTGEQLHLLKGLTAPFVVLAYSSDGALLAVGQKDGQVALFDA